MPFREVQPEEEAPRGFREVTPEDEAQKAREFQFYANPRKPAEMRAAEPQPEPAIDTPFGPGAVFSGVRYGEATDLAIQRRRAQEAGVSLQGAPLGARALGSLAPELNLPAAAGALSQSFGQSVPVRLGGVTGGIEFLDPRTNQPTLFNPPGLDPGDPRGLVGPAMSMVPEALGGAIGGVASRSPQGAVAGSSGGATAGEYARLWLARRFGVLPAETSDAEMLQNAALRVGAPALAGGELGLAATRVGRVLGTRALQELGANITPGDSAQFQRAVGIAQDLESQIGHGFKLTASDIASMADLRIAPELDNLERRIARIPEIGGPLHDARREQRHAMSAFFEEGAAGRGAAATPFQVGQEFKTEAQRLIGEEQGRLDAIVNGQQQAAQNELETTVLEQGRQFNVNANARNLREGVIRPQQRAAGAIADARYREVDRLAAQEMGTDRISTRPLRLAARDAQRIVDSNIFKSLSPGDQDIILIAMNAGQEVLEDGSVINRGLRLSSVQGSLSALRRLERQATSGDLPDTNLHIINKLEQGLLESRSLALQNYPRVAVAVEDAERFVREIHDRFDRTVIGDITAESDGRSVIPNQKVFGAIFGEPHNIDASSDLFTAIDQPYGPLALEDQVALGNARDSVRQGLLAKYRAEVPQDMEGGLQARIRAHDDFVFKYGEMMRPWFSPAEFNQITNQLDGSMRTLARERVRRDRLMTDMLQQPLFRDLKADTSSPTALFHSIWTQGDVKAQSVAMDTAKRIPGMTERYQGAVISDMRAKLKAPRNSGMTYDFRKLDDYLNKHGDQLTELFDAEYVSNLEALQRAATAASSRPAPGERVTTVKLAGPLYHLARVAVGVLSRPARTLTSLMRLQQKSAEQVLAEAMADPQKLAILMSRRTATGREGLSAVLGALGATEASSLLVGTDLIPSGLPQNEKGSGSAVFGGPQGRPTEITIR